MKIKWSPREEAAEATYDVFVRNDASLCRAYPAWMSVKNAARVRVKHACTCTGNYFNHNIKI